MTNEVLKQNNEPDLDGLQGFEVRMIKRYLSEIETEIQEATKRGKSSIITEKRNFQVKEFLEECGYVVVQKYNSFDDETEEQSEYGEYVWLIIW
jgi:hypothetical protein